MQKISNFFSIDSNTGRIWIAATLPDEEDGDADGWSDFAALYGLDLVQEGTGYRLDIKVATKVPGGTASTPAISANGKRVYIADAFGSVYAINAENGEELWSIDIGSKVTGSLNVAADNGEIFANTRTDIKKLIDRGDRAELAWTAAMDMYEPGRLQRNFNAGPGESERFKFAIMSSSDNHSARAGVGFEEVGRHKATDLTGPKSIWLSRIMNGMGEPLTSPVTAVSHAGVPGRFTERSRSFVYTGGLIATHASGRDRQSIWDALQRKEIYGTSGPRILLWFTLLDAGNGDQPMGSELTMSETPRFQVRAVGSFKQKQGCPDYATDGLRPERLEHLCYGECYNPGDERHRIARIEVIKITPQNSPEENLDELIQDTWKTFDCDDTGDGCVVKFDDADFVNAARDSLYYVRAIQQPTPTINGDNLRCEYDENGQCIKVNPCFINGRTDYSDDCLAPAEHRAWSSPIFVDFDSSLTGVLE